MIQILDDNKNNTVAAYRNDVAKILVLGVGGGGCNAVNRMVELNDDCIEFVAVNTDLTSLNGSHAQKKVEIGVELTKGRGAGARPEIGKAAAEENLSDVESILEGVEMVFITAGMGGGTGTGACPVIAKAAKEKGILTVAVVTKPFLFEGRKRMKYAMEGIEELKGNVDTLIVIPNQKLIDTADKNTTMGGAYILADNVLQQGVTGVANLVTKPGEINLDFADITTVMKDKGLAHFGIGESDSIEDAARKAIESPLLETSIDGAQSVIVNFTSGPDLNLLEANAAAEIISDAIDEDAEFIFGTSIDESLGDRVVVTVIATGLKDTTPQPPKKSMGRAVPKRKDTMDDINNYNSLFDENKNSNVVPVNQAQAQREEKKEEPAPSKLTPGMFAPKPNNIVSRNNEPKPERSDNVVKPGMTQTFTPVKDEEDFKTELNIPTFVRKR